MPKTFIWYPERTEFWNKLQSDVVSNSTARGYLSQLIRDSAQGEIARNKYLELMNIPLPQIYEERSVKAKEEPGERFYTFYYEYDDVTPQDEEESSEESSGDSSEDLIEEERKQQVAFLLDMMKEIMDSDQLDSTSKLSVVSIFISKLETIKWAQ